MGIYGLTGFIESQDEFFTNYELHGGYLVIDGHALAFELYRRCTEKVSQRNSSKNIDEYCQANSAFGGDYDKYAHWIEEFVKQLRKCEVTPLVLMDGGIEIKKMGTLLKRMKDKLDTVAAYHPSTRKTKKELMPSVAMHVFISTLKQSGVIVRRCIFEGDPCIAGVAKILDCPVLSQDSDFYVFGTKYISLEHFHPFVAKKINNRHVMRCKLFEIENLFQTFPGLTHDILPIVAVLQGNDYIESSTFKNFCDCFEQENPGACIKTGRIRIENIFAWLQDKNLNDAISAILCTLPKGNRKDVLDKIEIVINGYLDLPYDMLLPLRFEKEYEEAMKKKHIKFEFKGNIETLKIHQFWPQCNFTLHKQLRNVEKRENSSSLPIKDFVSMWPSWFAHNYNIANFPSYFVQLMFNRLFVGTTQMEDLRQPSAEAIAYKFVSVIDDLLLAGRQQPASDLFYVTREENHFVNRCLDIHHGVDSKSFPSLDKLRDLSIIARKKIIDDTLGISGVENFIENIPEEWKLYVATMSFWMKQTGGLPRNFHHIHAILFTMLMGVIDQKIGYHRSLKKLKLVKFTEKIRKPKIAGNPVTAALKSVTKTDCLNAAPFFIENYKMDKKLCSNSMEFFDTTIVHAFSQFQSCIKHAIALNALLGCPYVPPRLGELFNGTMLYNLYRKFQNLSNVDEYIAMSLQKSPSLLHLLNMLNNQMKRIIDLSEIPKESSQQSNGFSTSADESLIFSFYGIRVSIGPIRECASISLPLEKKLSKLKRTNWFTGYEQNEAARDEIRRLLTLKGRNIFDLNLACSVNGRVTRPTKGGTKRKNKKQKRIFQECLPALRKKSKKIRRSSKQDIYSECYDGSSFDEFC